MGRSEFGWFLPFAALAAGLQLAAAAAAALVGRAAPFLLFDYYGRTLTMLPALLVLWLTLRVAALTRARDPAPLRTLAGQARRALRDPEALVARLGALLLMPAAMAALAVLKMLMPDAVGGFTADGTLARVDRLLFLGTDPWRITHALFGSPLVTVLIDRLYTLWVPMLGAATGFFALFAAPAERARFFLTYLLCWILLGTGGAWLGASAGPCFLGLLGAPEAGAYAGLVERLNAVDAGWRLGAVGWQGVLWDAHADRRLAFAMGISAMPSMHVSVSTLYVLVARRYGRGAFRAALAFGAVMVVGSVHLGWHYAVDGLASIAGTMLIWRAVDRWLVRRAAAPPDGTEVRPALA